MSYDGLDKQQKNIFLDIACLFLGKDRNTAIRIWDGTGWEGELGFQNLENRCLLELDDKNQTGMHHQRETQPPDCWLRIWCPTDNPFYQHSPVCILKLQSAYENNVVLSNF